MLETAEGVQQNQEQVQGLMSTRALPKNVTNELEAIYNAGVNIKSEIQKLFNMLPTTNGDLRDQIAEVTNYVMRQDRWIYARIDALSDVVAEYNTRITSISNRATDIHNYAIANRSRISSIDNQLQDVKGTITAVNDYAVVNRSRISSLDTQFQAEKEYSEANRGRITALDRRLTPLEEFSEANRGRITALDQRLSPLEEFSEANRGRISNLDGQMQEQKAYSETNRGRINTLDARTTVLEHDRSEIGARSLVNEANIEALSFAVAKPDLSLISNLFGVNTISSTQSAADGVYTKLQKFLTNELKGQLVELRSVAGLTNTKLDELKAVMIDEVKAQLVMVRNNITALNANMLLNTTAISGFADAVNENFKTLFVAVEGLKKDIKDSKIDYTLLKKTLEDTLNIYYRVGVDYQGDIATSDGVLTKLFKGQITRLMNDNFLNLEVFNKALTDNLRAEFKLLNDWFALIVDWLDMLYEKPSAVFEGGIFDYERLQEMLDGISFGNVVNEAGTNLWDVLQELISALGGVVESILSIVPDLIEQLIALIIPENPNFFSEDVNSLIDSFDSKFEWATSISDSFNSVFSQPKSIKSLTVAIAGKEYKVVPDFVDLGLIKTILTGYFCFLTMLTTYRRIVGSGDLVQ